jgi:hypothetical protein
MSRSAWTRISALATRAPSSRASRLPSRFAHHIIDFAEQLVCSIRLADEVAVIQWVVRRQMI